MPRALIILVIALVAILSNGKKKKKGTGRQTAPGRQARPWPDAQRPDAEKAPVQAARPEPVAPGKPERPQAQVTPKMPERERKKEGFGQGESRECAHGVVGGSLAGDAHEGELRHAVRRAPDTHPVEPEPFRPRVNARELRRAVVMSEILKRPGERRRRI